MGYAKIDRPHPPNFIEETCAVPLRQSQMQTNRLTVMAMLRWTWAQKTLFLILAVVAAGGYYAYWHFSPAPAVKKTPPQVVSTVEVKKLTIPIVIEASGNIVAANIVDIRPQTTNIVTKVHIQEGQNVRTGDLLFSLDDRADRANYEKAKALAEDAERQYQRAQELVAKKFIAQSAADTALANRNSALAAAKAAEATLSYATIRSPIQGRAGVINVFPGSLVQSGANVVSSSTATATTTLGAMVTITQLDPINVQFTIAEKDLPLIHQDRSAREGLPVAVEISGSRQVINGRVMVIDNQVDPAIGAVRVKAQIRNPNGLLIPGQFVRVKLTAKDAQGALVVPTQAIVTNSQGDHLYVVDAENKVALNPIKVVYQYQGQAVVTGVLEGEKIVVEGKQNLRPGNLVAVPQAAPSTTGK